MENCPKCRTEMKPGKKLDSGNSLYMEYVCPKCNNRITKCIGVKS